MSWLIPEPHWPAEEPEPENMCSLCGEEIFPNDEISHEAFPVGVVHLECAEEAEAESIEQCVQCNATDVYLDPKTDLCEWCEDLNARDDAADAALNMYFEEGA